MLGNLFFWMWLAFVLAIIGIVLNKVWRANSWRFKRHSCLVCHKRVSRYDDHLLDPDSPCSQKLAADPSCRMCLNPVENPRDTCGECKGEPVSEKRLPVPADFLKWAIYCEFPLIDPQEAGFSSKIEELDRFLSEYDEGRKQEAELDQQIDDLVASLDADGDQGEDDMDDQTDKEGEAKRDKEVGRIMNKLADAWAVEVDILDIVDGD